MKVRHLLKLIFEVDANNRITAEKILKHPWLVEGQKRDESLTKEKKEA